MVRYEAADLDYLVGFGVEACHLGLVSGGWDMDVCVGGRDWDVLRSQSRLRDLWSARVTWLLGGLGWFGVL